ncbi:MAG: hypothetical protein CM15mP33_01250 [Candidatus Neomarinimicrobiota bacterium]|nr:MAG: hypothetical protein CM15mP33_01250 [Candidatus Neomarinimicrobiota bacterium]
MFDIKLENFEGPLDLLLYFIKRDKIDIYDIPITQITNEYIAVMMKQKARCFNCWRILIYGFYAIKNQNSNAFTKTDR